MRKPLGQTLFVRIYTIFLLIYLLCLKKRCGSYCFVISNASISYYYQLCLQRIFPNANKMKPPQLFYFICILLTCWFLCCCCINLISVYHWKTHSCSVWLSILFMSTKLCLDTIQHSRLLCKGYFLFNNNISSLVSLIHFW